MRLLHKKTFSWLTSIMVLAFFLGGCKKINEPEPFVPDRIFTPTGLTTEGAETSARIYWRSSLFSGGQDVTYKLEIYDNAAFTGTPVYSIDTDTIEVIVTDADIAVRTDYWARVKANATSTAAGSLGWVATTTAFRMTGEQLFLPINDNFLTDVSVKLQWRSNPDLTKIRITPNAGTGTDHTLTPGDITAAEKIITGLTAGTNYTAEIFKGTASKGILNFSTKSATPTGANVVNVGPTDDLATLIAAAPLNAIFVLPQGVVYGADAEVILPANASFTIFGQYGPNRPVIAFNGLRLPTVAGTIRFENIDFTGYQGNNSSGTKRNYIFNQSAANTTEAIIFENCIIRNLVNTPLRLQGSAGQTINNVRFNKCTAYDIGNNGANGTYAFLHTNVATGKINNIRITNSTLYQVGYSIILHNAAPSISVSIENSTFDDCVGNGRYFIDYNAQSAGSLMLTNVIIGKSLSPAGTANGIRSTTAATGGNNFQVANTAFVNNPIPAIITYSGTNIDLFTSPSTGNFLIKDVTFAGKSTAGDPKWRL